LENSLKNTENCAAGIASVRIFYRKQIAALVRVKP
jgi:hypothetical protein